MVSSGAIRPILAPISIDRLHSVSRPSTPRARTAEPAYSTACPVPAAAPNRPIACRIMSFGPTPGPVAALEPQPHPAWAALAQGLGGQGVDQLGCADTEGEAPSPPLVQVWLSPQINVAPGSTMPEFRPHHMHDALAVLA